MRPKRARLPPKHLQKRHQIPFGARALQAQSAAHTWGVNRRHLMGKQESAGVLQWASRQCPDSSGEKKAPLPLNVPTQSEKAQVV